MKFFDETRRLKIEKYKNLADELSTGGKKALVEGIAVRTIGSWDVNNDKSLRRICAKIHLKTLTKIMIGETISLSKSAITRGVTVAPNSRRLHVKLVLHVWS